MKRSALATLLIGASFAIAVGQDWTAEVIEGPLIAAEGRRLEAPEVVITRVAHEGDPVPGVTFAFVWPHDD